MFKTKNTKIILESWRNFIFENEEEQKQKKSFKFLYLKFFDEFCPDIIKNDLSEIKDRENNFGDFLVFVMLILNLKRKNGEISEDEYSKYKKMIFTFYSNGEYDESISYKMYTLSSDHDFSFSDDELYNANNMEDVKSFIKDSLESAYKIGQENFNKKKSFYQDKINDKKDSQEKVDKFSLIKFKEGMFIYKDTIDKFLKAVKEKLDISGKENKESIVKEVALDEIYFVSEDKSDMFEGSKEDRISAANMILNNKLK